MACIVSFNEKSLQQLKSYPDQLLDCLYNNFISISKRFHYPDVIQSFEGKFKPSWDENFANSAMKSVFIAQAKENQLYHYHFGYKFYIDGKDPHYDGKVSDGIIHIRIYDDKQIGETEFRILEICTSHSPFIIPYLHINDEAVKNH